MRDHQSGFILSAQSHSCNHRTGNLFRQLVNMKHMRPSPQIARITCWQCHAAQTFLMRHSQEHVDLFAPDFEQREDIVTEYFIFL
jgi:hypothetical protein